MISKSYTLLDMKYFHLTGEIIYTFSSCVGGGAWETIWDEVEVFTFMQFLSSYQLASGTIRPNLMPF